MEWFGARYRGENTGLQWKVTIEPAETPVTLTELKNKLKIDHAADDTLLTNIIAGSTKLLEKALSQSFVTQTITAEWETYSDEVELPRGPHQSINSVTRLFKDETEVLVENTGYYKKGIKNFVIHPTQIYTASGGPNNYGLQVEFVAGYGAASAVTQHIKDLVLEQSVISYELGDVPMALSDSVKSRIALEEQFYF